METHYPVIIMKQPPKYFKAKEIRELYVLPYGTFMCLIEPIKEELKLFPRQRNLSIVQVKLIFKHCSIPENLPEKYKFLLD